MPIDERQKFADGDGRAGSALDVHRSSAGVGVDVRIVSGQIVDSLRFGRTARPPFGSLGDAERIVANIVVDTDDQQRKEPRWKRIVGRALFVLIGEKSQAHHVRDRSIHSSSEIVRDDYGMNRRAAEESLEEILRSESAPVADVRGISAESKR